MKYLTGPRFDAPFNIMKAMSLLFSAAPRPYLAGKLKNKRQLSPADVAKLVKTSRPNIVKLLEAQKDGMQAVHNIAWDRRGRPPNNKMPAPTEIDVRHLVRRLTLKGQTGLNLRARALAFEGQKGRRMTYYWLRDLYRLRKVKKLRLRVKKGFGTWQSMVMQRKSIKKLQREIRAARRQGLEIVQVDESTFQPTDYGHYEWAPAGKPLNKPGKHSKLKYEACCGAVSEVSGYIMIHTIKGAPFYGADFADFVRELREFLGYPFALLIDNARIHGTPDNVALFEELGITMIKNVPYRPDLMGIEAVWKMAKDKYRVLVRQHTVQGEDWN